MFSRASADEAERVIAPLAERQAAIRVGRVTAVARNNRPALERLACTLSARGFVAHSTRHFVALRNDSPDGGAEQTVDEDLAGMLANELGPLGILRTEEDYGNALSAIIASAVPAGPRVEAWRRYSLNTLARLRALMDQEPSERIDERSHIAQFAAI
jgi:hypothetical protein